MADRFVAVDAGKFSCKLALANIDCTSFLRTSFRTKMSEGYFEDDAIENNTFVAEIDGKVYKIGNGATQEAELSTSKRSLIHRNVTLLALANIASEEGNDCFHVAICMPENEYANVPKRLEYKNYILPDGDITVTYRTQRTDKITRTFTIVKKYVYPEGAGGLYTDPVRNAYMAGVIDIGGLNCGLTYYSELEPDHTMSASPELGGMVLIQNLADALSGRFGRVDEKLVNRILFTLPPEEQYLASLDPKVAEESREFIRNFKLDFVKKIRRKADALGWPLDYMPLTFVGGTSKILAEQIYEVFGSGVYIPAMPEYLNAIGALRRMVAYECGKIIEISDEILQAA